MAWKIPGADRCTVWTTDDSGHCLLSAFNVASGTSAALQSFEPSFQQGRDGSRYVGLVLNGSSGGQTLTAGSSPTTLISEPNDTLNGGAGADTFVFLPNFGANTVDDFAPGTDALQIRPDRRLPTLQARVAAMPSRSDKNIMITHDSLDVVTLHDMQFGDLHASDVLWYAFPRWSIGHRCCDPRKCTRSYGRICDLGHSPNLNTGLVSNYNSNRPSIREFGGEREEKIKWPQPHRVNASLNAFSVKPRNFPECPTTPARGDSRFPVIVPYADMDFRQSIGSLMARTMTLSASKEFFARFS